MTDSEKKKAEENLSKYRELLDLTLKHQEKKGIRPYSYRDRYDEICEKER